jgi:hypothetical protein
MGPRIYPENGGASQSGSSTATARHPSRSAGVARPVGNCLKTMQEPPIHPRHDRALPTSQSDLAAVLAPRFSIPSEDRRTRVASDAAKSSPSPTSLNVLGRRWNLYSVFKDPFAQPVPRLIAQYRQSEQMCIGTEGGSLNPGGRNFCMSRNCPSRRRLAERFFQRPPIPHSEAGERTCGSLAMEGTTAHAFEKS